MKRMYRLSYIDKNKKIIPIDLTGCENYINGDIQFIDSVTMKFSNEKELIDEMILAELVPSYVTKLYVSYDVEKGKYQNIIYDGDILLFSNSLIRTNIRYAEMAMKRYKLDPINLMKLGRLYLKKYENKKGMNSISYGLISYANLIISGDYYSLSNSEKVEINEYIQNFVKHEFYNSNGKVRYKALRDFVIKVMYVDDIYDISRRHDYLNFNNCQYDIKPLKSLNDITECEEEIEEDFRTYEDYLPLIKECKGDDFEAYQDGNDYIAPLSREDYIDAIKCEMRKVLRKNK